MMISIIHNPALKYPDAADHFSPDECYPEYQQEHISPHKNMIYKAVRDCLAQAGLDDGNYGTPLWNPLGEFIRPGDRVFLLCNFAHERRPDETMENFRSRCSHGSVIRAMADYILIAAGKDGGLKIGNASTQVCHWNAVLRDTEADKVFEFYQSVRAPVEAKDLRLYVTDSTRLGAIKGVERRSEAGGICVALNQDSLFDELDRKQDNRYRIMNYDPNRIKSYHSHGHHEYVINRAILESDVIVGLPKLKTHEKTGITCALKGMVGTVGHKDSLPHHRYGPPEAGGDEYPSDKTGLMRLTSAFHEAVQQTKPDTFWGSSLRVIYKTFCRSIKKWSPVVHGAWWGNDTCWRMVLDLVRIATYANAKGELGNAPCRRHLVLTDGVIGGEGDGPAFSTAIHSGLLSFSDDLVAADYVNALLMGFDPGKIPLIREAAGLKKYPLLRSDLKKERLIFNRQALLVSKVAGLGLSRFEPQDGWKEVL